MSVYAKGGSEAGNIFENPKEVNIHGKINSELDEVDLVKKIIYEDKSAAKLYMDNPDFPQTEAQWAYKQIYKKGSNRINALQQADFTLSGNGNLPDVESLKGIKDYVFRIGNERLTNERFTGWTGYYTYDPRGSVTGVTGSDGYIWQSYRYNAFGDITFGKSQYNNVYSYNAEDFNPNMDAQYLRARYYSVKTAGFISEDSYLGDITDPLTLNRYNYVKGSPLNYMDPSGHSGLDIFTPPSKYVHTGDIPVANDSNASYDITKKQIRKQPVQSSTLI